MDETVLQVLKEEDRSENQQSRMWVMINNGERRVMLFHYSTTRETSVADEMLDNFNGALITGGYVVYDKIAKAKTLTHLACWAHARRYFKETSDAHSKGTSGKPREGTYLYSKAISNISCNEKSLD